MLKLELPLDQGLVRVIASVGSSRGEDNRNQK
jgi:hypothetical protein